MRRLVALLSLVPAAGLVLASCGGSSAPVRSAPPTTAVPMQSRLHLAEGSDSAGAASVAPAVYPVRPTQFVLDAPLAHLGSTAVVRRLVPHQVNESDVRGLAAALGLDGGAVVRTNDGFAVSGADASLTVSVNGGSSYVTYGFGAPGAAGGATGSVGAPAPAIATAPASIATVPPTTTTTPSDVPDAGAVETSARALLDRMGVLGNEQWAADVSDSGGVAVACPAGVPCPIAPPVVSQRTATFHRMIDGVAVQGADWSVTVGAHGRIEAVSGTWAAAEADGTYPLRSTDGVFTDLRTGKTRPVGPQPMAALGAPEIASPARSSTPAPVVVHITGVSLGYAPWDAFDARAVHVDVVPTYRFHARADAGGGSYDIEVLALDPAGFDIGVRPEPVPKPIPAPVPAPAPSPPPAATRPEPNVSGTSSG